MRIHILAFILLGCLPCAAQFGAANNTIDVSGEALVKVVPDRVRLTLGVETRNKDLDAATAQNEATVAKVLAAAKQLQIAATDTQTDYLNVSLAYDDHDPTLISYYTVSRGIDIYLRNVAALEPLLKAALHAGANHVYDVELSTSELRKYRDQARALAVKAAMEKANDMAQTAGLHLDPKPLSISSYNFGGGYFSYGCCGYRRESYQSQNVIQEVGSRESASGDGAMALGTIPVTASVTLRFQLQ